MTMNASASLAPFHYIDYRPGKKGKKLNFGKTISK
jgi:hypothetical protein